MCKLRPRFTHCVPPPLAAPPFLRDTSSTPQVGRLIHEAATRSSGFDPSPRKANDSEDLDRRFYKDPENRRARASTSLELYKQHRERDLPKTWAASVSR
eukprot:1459664-Rhodomonas_salina.2